MQTGKEDEMLRVNTTQFGEVGLAFHHRSGDPNGELLRILRRANDGEPTDVAKDMLVVEKLLDHGIRFYVDTRDRYTRADIRLSTPVETRDKESINLVHETSGFSHVHPNDAFKKEEGRLLALERAIEHLPNVTEKTRREILTGYHSR